MSKYRLTTSGMDRFFVAMSKWAQRASQYLLVGILLVSMGGHLALLQTVAWGNMIVGFSTEASFTEAVEKTFDGEHPCELCKVVKKSKSEEDKKPLLRSEMKLEVALPVLVRVPQPRYDELVFRVTGYSGTFAAVYHAVPMRPPRGV